MDNYNLVRMQEGQVIEVMQTGRFWKGFPSLPTANWHSLFDIRAALGFFCLLFAIVAFFVGQWFLMGNTEAAASGRFLSFMVLGVLYSTVAGLLFLTLNLWQRNTAAVVEETP